jgi:hypothetical protein
LQLGDDQKKKEASGAVLIFAFGKVFVRRPSISVRIVIGIHGDPECQHQPHIWGVGWLVSVLARCLLKRLLAQSGATRVSCTSTTPDDFDFSENAGQFPIFEHFFIVN